MKKKILLAGYELDLSQVVYDSTYHVDTNLVRNAIQCYSNDFKSLKVRSESINSQNPETWDLFFGYGILYSYRLNRVIGVSNRLFSLLSRDFIEGKLENSPAMEEIRKILLDNDEQIKHELHHDNTANKIQFVDQSVLDSFNLISEIEPVFNSVDSVANLGYALIKGDFEETEFKVV